MYTALYEGKYGHFQKSNGRFFIREETLCLFNRIPKKQRFVSGTPGAAGMHKFETSCTVWVLHTAPARVCRVNPFPKQLAVLPGWNLGHTYIPALAV